MKQKLMFTVFALTLLTMNLTSCNRNEISKSNDTVDKAETFHLVEKRQRVMRYNCQNVLISDRVETVQAPILPMSIKPKTNLNVYSSTFKNLTVGTTAGSVINYTDFTIDLNPGLLNLEVQLGSNQISYQFYYCDQLSTVPGSHLCATPAELRESGSVFINVSYENIDLDGTSAIHPSPESCTAAK